MTTNDFGVPITVKKSGSPPAAPRSRVFPIVGVGASAGGLEALSMLLTHLPVKTGMAFVLVQHLDPTRPSQLADLLSRVTKMPVNEAIHGMAIEPDQVYIIPPNANLAILGKLLELTPRVRDHHTPIDFFFQSLARSRQNLAIGVVLSGAGTDGTLGLRAIKAGGGVTFAQDTQTAGFGSMPHSAIASGNVDFVLSPDGIARELARIAHDPYFLEPKEPETEEESKEGTLEIADSPEMGILFATLLNSTGVDFSHYKRTTILRRIRRRMLVHQIDKLADFYIYLKQNPAEVTALYQDLLINVTEFFRNPEVFEFLVSEVFPKILMDRPADQPIRVWTSGCSSGEEAYSLAISLLEFLMEKTVNTRIQIFGTDLSESAIEMARAGFYPESSVATLTPERLRRFFSRAEGGYRISKTIRDICVFARHNLLADPPFSHMDLISCRNVMIYMDSVLQRQLMPVFHYALNPNGVLMLGNSEGIGRFSNLFEVVDRRHKLYSKKLTTGHERFDFVASGFPAAASARAASSLGRSSALEQQKELDRVLLANYAPVALLVSKDFEVLQSRGDTSPYIKLPDGKPSLNLMKMAREGLGFELRKAATAVIEHKTTYRRDGIEIKSGGRTRKIRIELTPLKLASINDVCFVVVFDEPAAASGFAMQSTGQNVANPAIASSAVAGPAGETSETGSTRDQERGQERGQERIQELEAELANIKEYLQSVIEKQDTSNEELQAANEEISSANEELQSTNEELETSKEELQSTNEELNTVNDELRARNTELDQLSNDLTNLLATVNIPIIMVDCDLRIRRLTPTAEKALRVIPADIGRLIADIKLNIKVPNQDIFNLEELILGVIESLQPVEKDVQDEKGKWYSLQIRPYRTLDNRIDGVVMALQDIDVLKRNEQAFQQSSAFLRSIVDTVREPLLVLDANLRVTTANQSFYSVFQVSPADTIGQSLYELGEKQWNIPDLRLLLGEILPMARVVSDFVVENDFPRIGQKTMLLNATHISAADHSNPLILLAIEDISARKRAEEGALHAAEKLASAGRIAATVSHEINNPLQILADVMYLMGLNPALDQGSRDLVRRGDDAVRLITSITKQTLGMFCASTEIQDVALSQVLDEMFEVLSGKCREQNVKVIKRYDVEGRIQAAPNEVRQIFTNLMVNALAAMPAGGVLTLHVSDSCDWSRPERHGIRVAIADSGVGIPRELQGKVFEPFFTTKGQRGTGLGLFVISGLVKKYGGTIRLHSSTAEGRSGTCFLIFFPVTATENSVPSQTA
jgi:two-component system CheB/CheR fusion protein